MSSNVYEAMEMKQPFEEVVADHSATVLRVCRFVVGLNDADDAWSETFLSALRAYPALPKDANIQAWLVTIAHRKSIDIIRSNEHQATPVDQVPDQHSAIGIPGSGDPDLWEAVGALPDKQRQAVAYHYLGGLPYKTVAEILGGTTEAARKAGSDGIKALRSALAAMHEKATGGESK
ncbi:MAG: RNA polymerase sigma factor [Candidatus Nanopelagicales bacterium]